MKKQYSRLMHVLISICVLISYATPSIAQGVLSICPYCMEMKKLCFLGGGTSMSGNLGEANGIRWSGELKDILKQLDRPNLKMVEGMSTTFVTSCNHEKPLNVSEFSSRSVCKGTMVPAGILVGVKPYEHDGKAYATVFSLSLSVPLTICDGDLVDVDEYVKDAFRLMAASELKKIGEFVTPEAIDERLKSTLVSSSLETAKDEIANKVKKEVMDELVSKKVAPKPKK